MLRRGVKVRWAVTVSIFGLLVAGAPVVTGGASAQTLKEAVEAAIAYHPQVRRDQAQSIAADQAVESAYSDYLPDLDLDVSTGWEWTSSPTTRGGRGGGVSEHRTDSRATATQLLFDFFETSNRVGSRRDVLRASHADLQATSERIARLAIDAYLSVQESREQVILAEGNVADHVAIVDLIRGRVAAGRSAEADLDQAVSRLALVRSNLVALQGREAEAASRYIETVGAEPDELETPDAPDFAEATDLDAALATAMDRNPAAHATAATWDARKKEIEVARSEYFPRFDVQATGGVADKQDGVDAGRYDASVLLRMQWNLFSGFGDLARTREATFEANAASREDANTRRVIREEVRVAFKLLETTKDRLIPLREDVTASTQTFQAYRGQFDLGQRTLLDLLDARDEQFDAEQDLVTGETDVLRATYDLLFSTGLVLDNFGIVIYEPELRFDERGVGVNQEAAATPAVNSDLVEVGEVKLARVPIPAATATDETASQVNLQGDIGLPGAGEYGFWLGNEVQRAITPVALSDEEAETVLSPDSSDPATVRREIAGIEVESIPTMAELPESNVQILPAFAYGGPVEGGDEEFAVVPVAETADAAAEPSAGRSARSPEVGGASIMLVGAGEGAAVEPLQPAEPVVVDNFGSQTRN